MTSLIVVGLGSLAFGLAMAGLAGGMAGTSASTGGYPRKVFHLGIFVGAVPALLLTGFWGAVVYGSVISLIVLGALAQGPGLLFFAALAREGDGPGSRRSILTPMISTALGGLASVLLVGPFAVVGFLTCGLGDAAGEPAGRIWGRHHYRTFPWTKDAPTRTLEGTLAVLGVGSFGAAVALSLLGASLAEALASGVACGAVGAAAEGLSGEGSDNFWVQLMPSLTAWWLVA